MKKVIVSLFIIFALSVSVSKAQDYKNALGLRAGFPSGLTFKHFFTGDAALEIIAGRSWGYRGFMITGLYEKHKMAFDVDGLYWFYGGGAHVGSYNGYYYNYGHRNKNYYSPYYYSERVIVIGIDAILGIEYKLKEVPFTLGLDLKPSFDLYPFGYGDIDGALSVRYTFK
jgi:hypothetical protein